jgi:hypothetical protein
LIKSPPTATSKEADDEGVRPDEPHPYLEAADAAQELMWQAWRNLFCVLPGHRRLERERRLLIEAAGEEDLVRIDYSGRAVDRVVIGSNMPPAYLDQLVHALSANGRGVRVEQASLPTPAGMSTRFPGAYRGS